MQLGELKSSLRLSYREVNQKKLIDKQQLQKQFSKQYQLFLQYKLPQILDKPLNHKFLSFKAISSEPEIIDDHDSVAYPLVQLATQTLAFYSFVKKFNKNKINVLEPAPEQSDLSEVGEYPLCFIPGVAFDIFGGRLGRGKGYYDRFLSQYKGLKVGVCFSHQLTQQALPTEEHDQRVDFILTERFLLKPEKKKERLQ